MRSRALQWSRIACAMAALFASLPVAGRILLGTWGFDGAAALACLCLLIGMYLYVLGRRSVPALPDPAAMLEEAIELAASGRTKRAVRLLTRAIRLSPRFWQAFEMRGKLYLQTGNPSAALDDFSAAAALAPEELHLQALLASARAGLSPPAKGDI